MAGSFYEIMRRLSGDPQLLPINDLRAILTDLLGLLPCFQVKSTVKRHPLIVMNAGASEACAKLEREFHISCLPALAHLSLKIEQATKRLTEEHLPKLRPQYHITEPGATFRVLEWYEEYIMLTFYKELTRRYHLTSAIWLHDGMWIPREVPVETVRIAEQFMLHTLNLDPTPVFKLAS